MLALVVVVKNTKNVVENNIDINPSDGLPH